MREPSPETSCAATTASTARFRSTTMLRDNNTSVRFCKIAAVPKISEERREARRTEILEAAHRCFAEHGYEGATVVKLEEATGLSRGAIFNYFPNKQALFVAVTAASSDRFVEIWLEHGF